VRRPEAEGLIGGQVANITQVKEAVEKQDAPVVRTIFALDGEPYLGLDGKPSTISVVGAESRKLKEWQRSEREKLRTLGFVPSGESAERSQRIDRAVAAVVDWSGWDKDGQELPCTSENVRALFAAVSDGRWIGETILRQVEAAIDGHGLFLKASSAN
jgi:hypothetical protein